MTHVEEWMITDFCFQFSKKTSLDFFANEILSPYALPSFQEIGKQRDFLRVFHSTGHRRQHNVYPQHLLSPQHSADYSNSRKLCSYHWIDAGRIQAQT